MHYLGKQPPKSGCTQCWLKNKLGSFTRPSTSSSTPLRLTGLRFLSWHFARLLYATGEMRRWRDEQTKHEPPGPLLIPGPELRWRVSSLYSSSQAWTNVAFRSAIILVWGPDPSWLAFSCVSYECKRISPRREERREEEEEVATGTATAAERGPFDCDRWKKLMLKVPSF